MICKNCGEDMSGDGYKMPFHCINASEEDWWYSPPDSGPYYCDNYPPEDDDDDGYALASAGFGTDEDYGYYGDYD
jgi:hypothetical protein